MMDFIGAESNGSEGFSFHPFHGHGIHAVNSSLTEPTGTPSISHSVATKKMPTLNTSVLLPDHSPMANSAPSQHSLTSISSPTHVEAIPFQQLSLNSQQFTSPPHLKYETSPSSTHNESRLTEGGNSLQTPPPPQQEFSQFISSAILGSNRSHSSATYGNSGYIFTSSSPSHQSLNAQAVTRIQQLDEVGGSVANSHLIPVNNVSSAEIFVVNDLKREPDESFHLGKTEEKPPQFRSFLNNNQMVDQHPYLNQGLESTETDRNCSIPINSQSPLSSPLRPVCQNGSSVSSLNLLTLNGRSAGSIISAASLNNGSILSSNGRHENHHSYQLNQERHFPIQLQQPPLHQPHVLQALHLHNNSTHQRETHSHIPTQEVLLSPHHQHQQLQPDLLLSPQHPPPPPPPVSISVVPYDDRFNDCISSNGARNQTYNYFDGAQHGPGRHVQDDPSGFQTPDTFATFKARNKNEHRRTSSDRIGAEDRENFATTTPSPSSNNDSDEDDDQLVIDTRLSASICSETAIDGYECGECHQICRTRGSLRKHLTTEHLTNDPEPAETIYKEYTCPVNMCRFVTSHRDELDSHVSEHIADGWTPTGKKRHNKNPLQRHRYNKEEFQCPHCDYNCTVEKAFNRHMVMHEGGPQDLIETVSCCVCGKDRPSESELKNHMKKHKTGKYYKCDICKFQTVQLKKLIQHRRMHTGEKPHLCPTCPYRAARRDNLRSHVRRMHKRNNMYLDTFTPKPLIVAQVEAQSQNSLQVTHTNHNVSQQDHQTLNQASQQHYLLGRTTNEHQQQGPPQGYGGIAPLEIQMPEVILGLHHNDPCEMLSSPSRQ